MTANQTDQSMRSQPPAGAIEPEPFADREARNPYFRWVVHLGLPMAISLLLHVTLFGVFALKTWQAFTERTIEVGEYEAGITDSLADRMEGAFKWPGETLLQAPNPDAFDFAANESFTRDLSDLGELDFGETGSGGEALDTGGFGIGTSGRSGILGLGGGAGSGGGGGIGSGFGTGTGIGKAGVWDLRIQANKIAYVIDFSGSIIVAVNELKRELKRSVGALKPFQSFNVFIFYSKGAGNSDRIFTENFEQTLQPATLEVRRKFFAWIERKTPQGSTHPLQAVKRALALKPDAIFFFSDGYFDDSVVAEIAQANRRVKAQIHCLVFDEILLEDTSGLPRMTDGARRLKRIADASGGKAKVVTGVDLHGP